MTKNFREFTVFGICINPFHEAKTYTREGFMQKPQIIMHLPLHMTCVVCSDYIHGQLHRNKQASTLSTFAYVIYFP